MRNLIILSFLVFAGSFTARAQETSKKHIFRDDQTGVSVEFPKAYTIDSLKNDNSLQISLKAVQGNSIFAFNITRHSHKFKPPEAQQLAQTTLDAFTEIINAQVQESTPETKGEYIGLNAQLYDANNGLRIKYASYISKRNQYEIIVITDKSTDSEIISQFFASFNTKSK